MTFEEQKLRHEAKSSVVTLCSLHLKTKYITLSHDVVCPSKLSSSKTLAMELLLYKNTILFSQVQLVRVKQP